MGSHDCHILSGTCQTEGRRGISAETLFFWAWPSGKIRLSFTSTERSPPMSSIRKPRTPSSFTIRNEWDLSDLVKEPVRQLETHLSTIDAQVTQIEAARDRLSPALSQGDFAAILRLNESVAQNAGRLAAYAYLWFSENTKDSKARSFKA